MKRPAFQFYPGDWLRSTDLRSCSVGARGLWIDMICLMHEGNPYGHLKVGSKVVLPSILARVVGADLADVDAWLFELIEAGVCSIGDDGCYLSRRMVRDEEIRQVRASGGKKSLEHPNVPQPKGTNKDTLKGSPSTPSLGGSPASSSSSSSSSSKQDQKISPPDLSSAGAEDANQPAEPIPYQPIVDLYNEICGDLFPEVLKITDARRKAIRARWNFDTKNEREKNRTNSLDYWRRYFACSRNIEFFRKAAAGEHRGEHAGWVPGFDYLMRETTLLGVLEGKLK